MKISPTRGKIIKDKFNHCIFKNFSGTKKEKSERRHRILNIRILVLVIISLLLAVFLFNKININDTAAAFNNSESLIIITACIIYLISIYFKSIRNNLMLKKYGISAFNIFTITTYHNFFNLLLPARTGELTFVYYLKKNGGANISKGVHVLVVTRIYDFIIVAVFFIVSLAILFGQSTSISLLLLGTGLLVLSVISLFSLKWIVHVLSLLFYKFITRMDLLNNKTILKIKNGLQILLDDLSVHNTAKQAPMLIITSILVWVTQYALAYAVILAFNIKIGIAQAIAGSTGQIIVNVLPVNSFGSIGTLEAGWASGYVLVGMTAQDAITTGLGYHIITIFASLAIALVCYIIAKINSLSLKNGPD